MSWFDASGFANIAKSALREAQKTIDKALDIREDEINAIPASAPVDTNSDDFFGTWGLSRSAHVTGMQKTADEAPKLIKLQPSLWGSFTGSFFDSQKSPSIDSLDDSMDAGSEHFSRSKLVVQQSDDVDAVSNDKMVEIQLGSPDTTPNSEVVVRLREKPSTSFANRLSAVSSESGKNSSDSVELITCSTECTTSPESELLSGEHSISTSSSARKQTSESVEVIADSLNSPSSVEIITSDSIDCINQDEFASPLESPMAEEEVSPGAEKNSPDSVEVIPEDQEESVAEDTMSYTSISESTSATVLDQAFVHLKPQKMLKDTYNTNMSESDVSLSPEKKHTFGDAITRAPSRSGMHLPLTQVLIDTQPQSSRQDLTNILKNTNIIDIPQEENTESCDEGSHSDRTVITRDSMDSSSDTSFTETAMSSVYLKNLIADAMTEKTPEQAKTSHFMDLSQSMIDSTQENEVLENISISQLDMPPRENSPVSSESRSDLVKIGSDHTSGDELETTTSSDIEIISSPNGDSSSTQSRQSPAKQRSKSEGTKEVLYKMTMKKAKGHTRELSEASSVSDDSSEVERLIKRIAEMTEILESRESKLVDVNRRNAELQELNGDLKHQLDAMLTRQTESADLSQVTEEYTQRLSALEKKFQQAIREKDTLRKQLEQWKGEAATRMSRNETEALVGEKDETIRELRQEGEKLSKQQLQHNNIIKKLRAKEKEYEAAVKSSKETCEDLSSETERLKRSLAAKEEMERSQIEAVHQLTAKDKKLQSDVVKLQGQVDDFTQKNDTLKKSLEAAKKELATRDKASSELMAREHRLESLESEKRQAESQNAAIIDELDDLRSTMRQRDIDYSNKEQELRKENNQLLRRLEDAEARNEELSQSVLEVSKPLVRQLESLQATHALKLANFDKAEQEMSVKIHDLQSKLQAAVNSERAVKDETVGLRSRLSDIESELSTQKHQNDMIRVQLAQEKTERQMREQDFQKEVADLKESLKSERQKMEESSREASNLREQLERKKCTCQEVNLGLSTPRTESNSPTLSLGKMSVSESLGSSFWSQEEPFETASAPRYTNMFEMQMLQGNLKQRDGEVQQLQWELNRREHERSLLNSEISSLLTKVEDLDDKTKDYDVLKVQIEELQRQYDTLCQLFGEKVEENEELKLDLQDVKDMYKSQIDELLRQQKRNLEGV